MRRYRVTVDGRTYEVEIDDPRARPITARVLGEVFSVDIDSRVPSEDTATHAVPESERPIRAAPAEPALPMQAAQGGQQVVAAPLPGTITALAASVGQVVQRGDALLTIEAMKMFNVIRSPWAGTVTAVHVSVGAHVAQGQLLVSLSLT